MSVTYMGCGKMIEPLEAEQATGFREGGGDVVTTVRVPPLNHDEQDLLDRLLENMGDAELNAKMKALTDEKESLKAQILDARQMEVSLEEQATRHQQMWDSIMECSAGYTEFADEFVRQIIQKITVEDEETIRIHFRDSEMVIEQE